MPHPSSPIQTRADAERTRKKLLEQAAKDPRGSRYFLDAAALLIASRWQAAAARPDLSARLVDAAHGRTSRQP